MVTLTERNPENLARLFSEEGNASVVWSRNSLASQGLNYLLNLIQGPVRLFFTNDIRWHEVQNVAQRPKQQVASDEFLVELNANQIEITSGGLRLFVSHEFNNTNSTNHANVSDEW